MPPNWLTINYASEVFIMAKKQLKLITGPEGKKQVIGISCHENDYRISWALNEKLSLLLKRSDNHRCIDSKSGIEQEFALYYYDSEDSVSFYLVSNISEKGFLVEELKNIDYLLIISGNLPQAKLDDMLRDIKEIEMVSAAFNFDLEKMKSKNRLNFV